MASEFPDNTRGTNDSASNGSLDRIFRKVNDPSKPITPKNLPGGPPVEPELFSPFFELELPREASLRVFWLIFEYRDWNQAYGKFLRELQELEEQSD